MKVYQALLLKVATPLAVCLAFRLEKINELTLSEKEWIALSVIISVMLHVILKSLWKETVVLKILVLPLVFTLSTVSYICFNIMLLCYVPVDNGAPFLQLGKLYRCLCTSLLLFLTYIFNICKVFIKKHSVFRFFTYIVFVIFNAVFLVYVICTLFGCVAENIKIFMSRREFEVGLNTSNSFTFERKLRGDNLSQIIYVSDGYGGNSSYEMYNITDRYGNVFPFEANTREYERRRGEDIDMTCLFRQFVPLHGTPTDFVKVRWKKRGSFINGTTDRIKIKTNIKESKTVTELHTRTLDVIFKLSVQGIEAEDFGMYECVTVSSILSNCNAYTEFFVGRFILKEKKLDCRDIQSVGISPEGYFSFGYNALLNVEDLENVNTQYTVNGRDIEDIHQSSTCSTMAVLYMFWNSYTNFNPLYAHFASNLFSVHVYTCVDGNLYGKHAITVYRDYFNTTTNRTTPVEIKLEEFVVEPMQTLWKNNTHHRQLLSKENLNMTTCEFNQMSLELVKELYDGKYRGVLNIIAQFMIVCVIQMLCVLLSPSASLYMKATVIPIYNKVFTGSFLPAPTTNPRWLGGLQDNGELIYDVMVSYADEDYDWVSRKLMPKLEKEFGLKVCFPVRDMIAGQTELQSLFTGMKQSKKILVVMSSSYQDDPKCNLLQLGHLFLPLVFDGQRSDSDLIFLKVSPVHVPRPLQWTFDLHVVSWTNNLDENIKWLMLKDKLGPSTVQQMENNV